MQRMMYRPKPLERQPLDREILVHGAMHYKCEVCGTMYRMWLEKGLEDKMQDEKFPELHKPVPYCIACTCGGTATHILWETDIRLDSYRVLGEHESYFENDPEEDCGKYHLRITAYEEQELENRKRMSTMFTFDENENCFIEDEIISPVSPGLEKYSMSQLKAEIRRRKRW